MEKFSCTIELYFKTAKNIKKLIGKGGHVDYVKAPAPPPQDEGVAKYVITVYHENYKEVVEKRLNSKPEWKELPL